MLSIPDMALLGAAALILFGPDQLPRVARKAGQMVREVQMTSQSFVREMERAADDAEERERLRELAKDGAAMAPAAPYVPDAEPHEFPMYEDDAAAGEPPAYHPPDALAEERAKPAPNAPRPEEGFHGPQQLQVGP